MPTMPFVWPAKKSACSLRKSETSHRHARYDNLSDEQILRGIMEKTRLLLKH